MNKLARLFGRHKRHITFVGCANGLGGPQEGYEHAPRVMRNSDLLARARIPHVWENIIAESAEPDQKRLAAIPHVQLYSTELARCTRSAVLRGKDLCVLGGDHSCAIGTWSGVSAALTGRGRLGLVWVDAHMDAHTPLTSLSGNVHGMPVAHLLGHGDAHLAGLFQKIPKVHPENLCLIGVRSFEEGEMKLLRDLNVRVFHMEEVRKRGYEQVLREALHRVQDGTEAFGLSVDLDGFDPHCAPAVGTPEPDGLNAAQFLRALGRCNLRRMVAAEIVEFLPKRDALDRRSEQLVVDLLRTIYGAKWRHM